MLYRLFWSRGGVLLAVKLARSKQHVPKIVFAANKVCLSTNLQYQPFHYTYLQLSITPVQLCSVLADYKEGYSALKREGWDISHYTRAAKDTGYSIEFEPEVSQQRISAHQDTINQARKEKNYSKSSTSLADRTGLELVSRSLVHCNSNILASKSSTK